MNLSEGLLALAWKLVLSGADEDPLEEAKLRRAVSTAYYALFHQVTGDATSLIAPHLPQKTQYRIQRWFDHDEMKKVCGRFLPARLDQPLLDLLGESASSDLQTVARTFRQLQEARHRTDYDLSYEITWDEVMPLVDLASEAVDIWQRIQGTAEANIFILSLLMWKNWEKER